MWIVSLKGELTIPSMLILIVAWLPYAMLLMRYLASTVLTAILVSCPPRTFIPALCNVLLDESASINVLEAAMRAVTFYLDVSGDCARRIVGVEGAVAVICKRLTEANLLVQSTRDLAMQCVKVRQRRERCG
jgi:E3 ubiquitin-protein ligase HECTD1